ncbi:unnamed protein product [Paramecium sonneborni]|uniref:Uncharacterized protein n=1 Tax=Paramecium sonneborni TaxID=65129 RepID=A0A8S1MIP2_9CILI|nr:unnamed protein product [Paramecium sonneborni]
MKSGLWDNMRKMVTLIDDLRDCGVQDYIKLPRICVVGMQSAGKSSLLENICGLDFLPRGDGVVTRRPLELRLVHIQERLQPWAIFKEVPEKKFTDFTKVREEIDRLTDSKAGQKKNILPDPIELTIWSPDCPDLTIIDLPGITLIPLKDSDQPDNIEEITLNMCRRYCEDERTIILCVMPASQDITTQRSLKLARQLDPDGIRTIGVITKIDIMGEGSDASKVLMNEEVKLRLGYIGVKNRSQQDIINKVPVQKALRQEEDYFANDPRYSGIPQDILGTRALIEKLTTVLYQHIRKCLPDIIKEIDTKADECEDKLKLLGTELPRDQKDKVQLVFNLLQDYTDGFKNTMDGKYDKNEATIQDEEKKIELTGGAKIKQMFNELYFEYADEKYHVTDCYLDKDIELADQLHQGDSIPGFPSFDSFLYLIVPQVQALIKPAQDVLDQIFQYMDEISQQILRKVFTRFPSVLDEISEMSRKVIESQRAKAEQVVINQIESEMNYIYTNDEEYLTTKADLVFKQNSKTIDPKKILVRELRNRVDLYYKILIRNLRDSIPKYIGYYLVKQTLDKMQMVLYDQMNKSDNVFQMLEEPVYILQERQQLQKTLKALKQAKKVLKQDPDLSKGRG